MLKKIFAFSLLACLCGLPACSSAATKTDVTEKITIITQEKNQRTNEIQKSEPVKTETVKPDSGKKTPAETPAAKEKTDSQKIVINLASRSLALYKGNEKIRLYPLGVGKVSTPTPTGYYKILSKEINPDWVDPGDERVVIPSGEDNPLGYRWMRIYGNYGIHGTNKPESIGQYVSNGCIRMFEKDVEALFDLVSVGMPVEITYNRVVVEKMKDNTVVYYIYPDGYNRQALDAKTVNKWLAGYGISAFESDDAILEKIKTSDGKPTYIGKVYNITVDGKKMTGKAVKIEDILYVPAEEMAKTLDLTLNLKENEGTVATPYGEAVFYAKKNIPYINADDASFLFHLDGGINKAGVYELATVKELAAPAKTEIADTADTDKKADAKTNDDKETAAAATDMTEAASPAAGVRPTIRERSLAVN